MYKSCVNVLIINNMFFRLYYYKSISNHCNIFYMKHCIYSSTTEWNLEYYSFLSTVWGRPPLFEISPFYPITIPLNTLAVHILLLIVSNRLFFGSTSLSSFYVHFHNQCNSRPYVLGFEIKLPLEKIRISSKFF